MIKNPSFSIIIPTFNSLGVLEVALESVVNQTIKSFEIIIVDGLSNDGTIGVIENYALKYPNNIKYVSEKDNGIYDAMNKGVELATGEWIYFLGSDDYFLNEDVLENVVVGLDANTDFLYGNTIWNNSIVGEEFKKSTLVYKNITHQAIFYNKSVFEKLGHYDLDYEVWADYEFNLRCFGDESINTKYIDLNIAQFSLGGFSTQQAIDKKFCKNALDLFDNKLKVKRDREYGISLEKFAKNELKYNFFAVGLNHLGVSTYKTGRWRTNMFYLFEFAFKRLKNKF